MRLHELPRNRPARIAAVDWAALTPNEARRLRELGVDEGVHVTALHRAPFGADPIAARIGRMTIAIRRATAAAILTEDRRRPADRRRMNPMPLVALVGNPNAGKSALFNALTGARQKVGNYPGVTVERKSGRASRCPTAGRSS